MDAVHRRPQLPALTYLDIEKVKREEEAYQHRNTTAQTLSTVRTASPTYQYPPGPPPPYSHPAPPTHQSNNGLPPAQQSVQTPPESRRTSGDDRDPYRSTTKQSLPSISEALGVDGQTSYHTAAPTPSQPTSMAQAHPQSTAPSSPSPIKRSYAMEPPQPASHPYSDARAAAQPYAQYRQERPQQSYAPAEPSRAAHADPRPPLHVQTSTYEDPRPVQQPATYPSYPPNDPSPRHESQSQSAGSMAPPSSFPYGYTPYPPRYAQPTPSTTVANPIYQPSVTHAAPPPPSAAWKSESASSRYPADERVYGESVKRHLDLYDLEAALNDIGSASGFMNDFSRRYGDRLHQTARSGPTLSTLPSVIEVEDMMAKSRLQMDALAKIREVILAQQAAYDQQAAEQRHQKAFSEAPPQQSGAEIEDSKGFGGDAKKRRGRAAPPGRCHSCNRAETPEWRRGPDGARTLCNACGLHYAKLTRKQNSAASKPAAVGSSNLRPKEDMH